ncbi:Crp/Fnr family transcriptional regulator [Tardiphaga alba]|uniref:Crp/Fnr family transcriptional regulator n=1 Tax=Tardiphaga alba TaxID=340268 RepID=A0ABX8AAJ3_9BRAD|nr:Crp/Fnr family transcriptional regulator [Tardiphaga alba]QUS38810.1 Crp/Fnr family transcriptional regulator [Tardiphaga alba]
MRRHDNSLLSRIDTSIFDELVKHATLVELRQGDVLAESHDVVDKVYFPHEGIISCVVELAGGGAIETGMIGRDGSFGAGMALDDRISLNHSAVQVGGVASVFDAKVIVQFADKHPSFRRLLMSYEHFHLAQVQQTAACNAVHSVQARTCKWLLRMRELAGDELTVTQQFLAQMMGVRRTSVTGVAIELQKAGMISHSRGRIHIMDVEKIRRWACECHEDVRQHYIRLFPPSVG